MLQLRFWDCLFSISSSLTSISSSITSILSTSAGQFSGVFEFLLFDSGGFLLMSPTCSVTNNTYFCKEPYFTKEKHLNSLNMILYPLYIRKYFNNHKIQCFYHRRSVNKEQTTGFHQIWLKQNDKYSSRNLSSLINLIAYQTFLHNANRIQKQARAHHIESVTCEFCDKMFINTALQNQHRRMNHMLLYEHPPHWISHMQVLW